MRPILIGVPVAGLSGKALEGASTELLEAVSVLSLLHAVASPMTGTMAISATAASLLRRIVRGVDRENVMDFLCFRKCEQAHDRPDPQSW
jgi:hypothetical protein